MDAESKYLWEKSYTAVRILCGNGSLRERLFLAAAQLRRVHRESLRGELLATFDVIFDLLTRNIPVAEEGAFQASLEKMTDEELTALSDRFVEFYDRVLRLRQ